MPTKKTDNVTDFPMKNKGGPGNKTFPDAEEFIGLFLEYVDSIVQGGYKDLPSRYGFARWMLAEKNVVINRRTVYRTIEKYSPEIKGEFKGIMEDIIASGGAAGKYWASLAIMALKNWCGWADKQDINQSVTNTAPPTESEDKEELKRLKDAYGVK